MSFIRASQRHINHAHSAIADAEARLIHSFTPEDIAAADDEMMGAVRYLARAVQAQRDWDAVDHDDYEEYPHVPTPAEEQLTLI
jgi:hypothetical protein